MTRKGREHKGSNDTGRQFYSITFMKRSESDKQNEGQDSSHRKEGNERETCLYTRVRRSNTRIITKENNTGLLSRSIDVMTGGWNQRPVSSCITHSLWDCISTGNVSLSISSLLKISESDPPRVTFTEMLTFVACYAIMSLVVSAGHEMDKMLLSSWSSFHLFFPSLVLPLEHFIRFSSSIEASGYTLVLSTSCSLMSLLFSRTQRLNKDDKLWGRERQ